MKLLWRLSGDGSRFLSLSLNGFKVALAPAGIPFLPMDERVATQAVALTPIHKVPFERMIIATALVYNAKLTSVDSLFSQYPDWQGV